MDGWMDQNNVGNHRWPPKLRCWGKHVGENFQCRQTALGAIVEGQWEDAALG